MLTERGVRLRANSYFWGVCLTTGALALFAVYHSVVADETDPGKSTSQPNSARLEAEIQSLHEELASTKELLREAASSDDELLLAQRGDGPARADDPPPVKSGAKSSDEKQDDKKFDNDAWRALDKELARNWRRGPGGPPAMHPGMDRGFRGGPPPWARHGFDGGPPWANHGHGRGGPPWAHHHRHGCRHWAHHHRHGHRAHHHRHAHRHGRGGSPGEHGGWEHRGQAAFGPGPRGGDPMMRISRRLDELEHRIDALMHEFRGTHEGPDRGGPKRDGPPHDGPPRDGPPRNAGPRDAAPPRKPGD